MKLLLLLSSILLITVACTTPQARAQVSTPTPPPDLIDPRTGQPFDWQLWINEITTEHERTRAINTQNEVLQTINAQSWLDFEVWLAENQAMTNTLNQSMAQWGSASDSRITSMDSAVASINSGIDQLQTELNVTRAASSSIAEDADGVRNAVVPIQQVYLGLLELTVDIQDVLSRVEALEASP